MLALIPFRDPKKRRRPPAEDTDSSHMSLHTLPYDLLLNITFYLDLRDIHALHLTCKSLYTFSTTKPVYRKLANDLLRRCRALPLRGFQRLTDLSVDQLIRAVNTATRYERAWRVREPRPISTTFECGNSLEAQSNGCSSWYKVVSAPPNEDVDWLSPITSSYTLCATKSGKVVCWDVQSDQCLAEWNPGERWELWKCRVEFEERTVFFTMAKVLSGAYDDERVMEFVLMKLYFPEDPKHALKEAKDRPPPVFSRVMEFKTTGVVMNVFLLDPSARLLAAFVWVSSSNTIGLYALLDWDKPEYVFIDTGIECKMSSNWSCILYERNIVIHSEESDSAFQYFYPLSLLEEYKKQLAAKTSVPAIAAHVPPAETLTKRFIFPRPTPSQPQPTQNGASIASHPGTPIPTPFLALPGLNGHDHDASTSTTPTDPFQTTPPPTPTPPALTPPTPNPFPFPPWYPESAHFVRQWWPSLPGIPRVSCTVVLLASHDPDTHRTRFVLAQHYFRVPLSQENWTHAIGPSDTGRIRSSHAEEAMGGPSSAKGGAPGPRPKRKNNDDALMRLWYVSTPFEVVCVLDGMEDEDENGGMSERPRPLVAVDFGHAVWIEYNDTDADRPGSDPEAKWLRFVTFPPYPGEDGENLTNDGGPRIGVEGEVKTLVTPPELDLDSVETLNIDQSQGAVILSVKEGKIFILCYE
ncbi:hypothetical protein PC9H_008203 [Pleurotus ostreatus]|uniref:F-box domain-containing protein n=1 Tax=Pleurotus ostreatus TaxID=5322 RepID=A0A8H6ZVE1_PLEOS|nr:uncharacterized protein PC9H_008203 [Pleurotus ostreatus]KAF7428966.1 hypothetical protein PC9H_008203 [Pleurotus ostreatus]